MRVRDNLSECISKCAQNLRSLPNVFLIHKGKSYSTLINYWPVKINVTLIKNQSDKGIYILKLVYTLKVTILVSQSSLTLYIRKNKK